MDKKTYFDKLKDPRWQKKRLEILNRDEWTCQDCGCETDMLQVHHEYYEPGVEPWDANSDYLITLCEPCHKKRKEYGTPDKKLIKVLLSLGFTTQDFDDWARDAYGTTLLASQEEISYIITWFFRFKDFQQSVIDLFRSEIDAKKQLKDKKGE